MAVAPERTRAAIYQGTRIPHPIPTVLRVPSNFTLTLASGVTATCAGAVSGKLHV